MKASKYFSGIVFISLMLWMSCSGDKSLSPVDFVPFGSSLSVNRLAWSPASQPADNVHTFKNRMTNFIWFNPVLQVPVKDIHPERVLSPNTPNRIDVLTLMCMPDSTQTDKNIWAGVMQKVPRDSVDQSSATVLDIMVKGDRGRLHVDLGVISEDVIPNGKLDSEDKLVNGRRNGKLDDGEDTGLDGISKPDPPQFNFPRSEFVGQSINDIPYDFWDVNQNGLKDADEPWSYDDFFYPEVSISYITEGKGSIDGQENNRNDELGNIPDTEDINFNNVLEEENDYYSYSVSLDKTSSDTLSIVGGNPSKGWFLYRIPFDQAHADRIVGSPTKSQIKHVRIWVDELALRGNDDEISIAEIKF